MQPEVAMKTETYEVQIGKLLEQLTLEEKIGMIHGAGLVRTEGVERLSIPPLFFSDGPMGVRAEFADNEWGNTGTTDDFVSYLPCNSAVASTWNRELAGEEGRVLGEEARGRGKDMILAPGINIKRSPFCGRNFEYYSEDPFLSGKMAAAVVRGVQEEGTCGAVIKHFACNNQEDNRMGVDVHISERALREIYLRGFEIAVKESAPVAIMTSYNRVNGVHAANSRALCTVIAREEWGFDGVLMSDWSTTAPEDGSIPWKCIEAGNDLIMPGSEKDDADIRQAYADGRLSEKEIRLCAGRIISLINKLDKKTKK